jgi:hypothetical protein
MCTLFVHSLLDGVFIIGFGGVVEGAAEASCGHVCASSVGEELNVRFREWNYGAVYFMKEGGCGKWLVVKAPVSCEGWWEMLMSHMAMTFRERLPGMDPGFSVHTTYHI